VGREVWKSFQRRAAWNYLYKGVTRTTTLVSATWSCPEEAELPTRRERKKRGEGRSKESLRYGGPPLEKAPRSSDGDAAQGGYREEKSDH